MPLAHTTAAGIAALFDLNVVAPSLLAHAALPHLRRRTAFGSTPWLPVQPRARRWPPPDPPTRPSKRSSEQRPSASPSVAAVAPKRWAGTDLTSVSGRSAGCRSGTWSRRPPWRRR